MAWLTEISKIYLKEELLLLLDEAFNIAKIPKYDGYQRGLVSMVYVFGKQSSGVNASDSAVTCAWSKTLPRRDECVIMQNQELAEGLHKLIIRKLGKQMV